jgi:hypothetical protein
MSQRHREHPGTTVVVVIVVVVVDEEVSSSRNVSKHDPHPDSVPNAARR